MRHSTHLVLLLFSLYLLPSVFAATTNSPIHTLTYNFRPPIGPKKTIYMSQTLSLTYDNSASFVLSARYDAHLETVIMIVRDVQSGEILCQREGVQLRCCGSNFNKRRLGWGAPVPTTGSTVNITVGTNATIKGNVQLTVYELPPVISLSNLPVGGYHPYAFPQYSVTPLLQIDESFFHVVFANSEALAVGVVDAPGVPASNRLSTSYGYGGQTPERCFANPFANGLYNGIFPKDSYAVILAQKEPKTLMFVKEDHSLDTAEFVMPFLCTLVAAVGYYFFQIRKRSVSNMRILIALMTTVWVSALLSMLSDLDRFAEIGGATVTMWLVPLISMVACAIGWFFVEHQIKIWMCQITLGAHVVSLIMAAVTLAFVSFGKWVFTHRGTFYSPGHGFQLFFFTISTMASVMTVLEMKFVVWPEAEEDYSKI